MRAWLDDARSARMNTVCPHHDGHNAVPGDFTISLQRISMYSSPPYISILLHTSEFKRFVHNVKRRLPNIHIFISPSCCHSQLAVAMVDESDEDMMPASRSSNNHLAEEDMMSEPHTMNNSSNDTWRNIINNVETLERGCNLQGGRTRGI